jgi:hypothetical protein
MFGESQSNPNSFIHPSTSSSPLYKNNMSSLPRTIKGFLQLGPSRFFRQLNNMGDTKVGTLVGTDKFGNKYYENLEESYGMGTHSP